MSLRGKEVRPLLEPELHEKLAIMAEFEGLDLAVFAADLLEKAIVGEWLRYGKLVARAKDIPESVEREEAPERNAGFVYVIRVLDRYKIGKAVDWRKRISNAMFSEPPEVVCVVETGNRHALERELHERYEALRRHGEWFQLADIHLQEIRSLPGIVAL